SLAGDDLDAPAVDPSRFDPPEGPRGRWSTLPEDWSDLPEERLLGHETLDVGGRAIASLPPMQAEVIRLRDALGSSSEEVRNALDLPDPSEGAPRSRSGEGAWRSGAISLGRGDVMGRELTCKELV